MLKIIKQIEISFLIGLKINFIDKIEFRSLKNKRLTLF